MKKIFFLTLISAIAFTSCQKDEETAPEKTPYFSVSCYKGKYNYSDPASTPVIVWTITPDPDFPAQYFHNSEPFDGSWCMPNDDNPLKHKNFRELIPELEESLPWGKAVVGDTLSAVVNKKVVERIILYIPKSLLSIPNYQSGSEVLENEYIK